LWRTGSEHDIERVGFQLRQEIARAAGPHDEFDVGATD